MVAGVSATPVTIPEETPTGAKDGAVVLHAPPPEALVSVLVCPTHIVVVPPIAAGSAFTVYNLVAKQPLLRV